jgi:hypothetical protein
MAYENTIALANKFVPLIDEVYKRESLTSRLDMTGEKVNFVGANEVKIFKTEMEGLGDYSRNGGFVDGDVVGTWETLKMSQDRGRSFQIDNMDNEETLGLAFGSLAGEFLRTKVVPEIDAYRFAKYAGWAGIDTAEAADITADTNVADLIDEAEASMGDNEVPREGRIIYVSEKAYKALKGNITRSIANEGNVSRQIDVYNGMEVVRVPIGRFNTQITLRNGSASGQEAGGFTASGYAINFMIIHPSAIAQVTKHVVPRIFSPAINQKADAWKFDYRVYHDAWVLDNKTKGIYLHRAATAN